MNLTFILPTATDRQIKAEADFQEDVLAAAGGFSRYAGFGLWKDADGKRIAEPHARIEVTLFENPTRVADLLDAFMRYGQAAGEKELFCTINGQGKLIPVRKAV